MVQNSTLTRKVDSVKVKLKMKLGTQIRQHRGGCKAIRQERVRLASNHML
jgi:hypothetical protein